jgi:hypothetical protein
MKRLLTILFTFTLISCSDDSGPQMGCMTGIPKSGGTERVLIKCVTKKSFLAGNNVSEGGTANFANYTNHEWKPVSDCSKCK